MRMSSAASVRVILAIVVILMPPPWPIIFSAAGSQGLGAGDGRLSGARMTLPQGDGL